MLALYLGTLDSPEDKNEVFIYYTVRCFIHNSNTIQLHKIA